MAAWVACIAASTSCALSINPAPPPHINNIELGAHGRYRTNVWDYAGANAFGAGKDDLKRHPTVKPVAMLRDAILDVTRWGEIKRLIINVPPRSLKSIVVNIAHSTWLLGHNPREHIVSASYSTELSEKFARDSKIVMEYEWYRRIFPRTVISKNRSTPADFNTTARDGRYTSSVDGTMTGRGGNVIIIDDPIKPSDISSESALNKVNEWYQNTLLSRLDDPQNGIIILIMQRVHENDLTRYLLENSTDWTHIKIPEVAMTDETWTVESKVFHRAMGRPLNPSRMPMEIIESKRRELGTYVWSAQ